jgi:hypothetical protein
VIIWLNGPFGGGKTTVMRELMAAWPDVLPFDPEYLGGLAAAYAPEKVDDWQDLTLWRDLTVAAADGLLRRYARPLVVPMTLLNEEYAVEIFDRLDVLSWPVFHVVLDAPADVVRARIAASGEGGPDPAGIAEVRTWRLDHLTTYEEARQAWLTDAATVVPTAGRAPVEIAADILGLVRPDPDDT